MKAREAKPFHGFPSLFPSLPQKKRRSKDRRCSSSKKSGWSWAFSDRYGRMGKGDEKMLERGKMDRDLVEFVVIDQLVPKEHLLRKIDTAVDFTRLYEMVEPLYCEDNGRPSIDPVVLFKMVLIQHLYGLPSLRQTAEEVSANICYRWFLGYTLQEETPHFSTVSYIPASVHRRDRGLGICVDFG